MYGSALRRQLCAAETKAGGTRGTQGQRVQTWEVWMNMKRSRDADVVTSYHFKWTDCADKTKREKLNLSAPPQLLLESTTLLFLLPAACPWPGTSSHSQMTLPMALGPWRRTMMLSPSSGLGLQSLRSCLHLQEVWFRFQPCCFVSSGSFDSSN